MSLRKKLIAGAGSFVIIAVISCAIIFAYGQLKSEAFAQDFEQTSKLSKNVSIEIKSAVGRILSDNSKSMGDMVCDTVAPNGGLVLKSANRKTSLESTKKNIDEAQELIDKANSAGTVFIGDANNTVVDDTYEDLGLYKITAYCNCFECCGKTDGVTASGTIATVGRTIAADNSVFPFGTQLVFNNHTYIVEDVGGAIKDKRIDLFVSTHAEADSWGVRYMHVYKKK